MGTWIDKPTLFWLRDFTLDVRLHLEQMPECFTDEQEERLKIVEQILKEKCDEQ